MRSGLQENRVGDNGADGGKSDQARKCVLRTVQENAQRKPAFAVRFDRSRSRTAAAARHFFVIVARFSRHFSSPELSGLARPAARPASALQYCLSVAQRPASRI